MEPTIAKIECWTTPARAYPEKRVGKAEVRRVTYKAGFYRCYGVNKYDLFQLPHDAYITTLRIWGKAHSKTWMVDDPPHWWAMENLAKNSSGNVLVAGLGLGLVLHALAANDKVKRIVVVEREPDVIKLIEPFLPKDSRREIVLGDFHDFINPEMTECFDWNHIIVDLWVTHSLKDGYRVLEKEVKPMARQLSKKWPNASLVFHGFPMHMWVQATIESSLPRVVQQLSGRIDGVR